MSTQDTQKTPDARTGALAASALPDGSAFAEFASVISEQLDKAEMWEKHYKTDPCGRIDEAFWSGKAQSLREFLDYVRRRSPNRGDDPRAQNH